MRQDDVAQRVWRYVTFANWTWSERDDAERTRAAWPLWRKAVRPIGALAWWAGIGVGVVTDESATPASIVLLVIVGLCVVYGTADGVRTRHTRRPASPTSARSDSPVAAP